MKWEVVSEEARLERYPVYGGWLVRNTLMFNVLMKQSILDKGQQQPVNGCMALQFISDPEHLWRLPQGSEIKEEK